jgi:type I restriction enzyme S subunit
MHMFLESMLSNKFLCYYLNYVNYKGYFFGTTRLKLTQAQMKQIQVPITTLEEQQRVVDRIEKVISSFDNAVDTLNKTKEQLAAYRQAVLESVFDSCNSKVTVESVCEHVTDGDHMPPLKAATGIPFIMISNINENHIDWSETAYVNEEYFKAIGERRTPKKGDILYMVTGSFGISVFVNFDKDFCFQRHIALLRPKESTDQRFLYYVLQTPRVYAQASKKATGAAQKTVGLGVLRKIEIPFIENTVKTSLEGAGAMRQSILKETFEGGL